MKKRIVYATMVGDLFHRGHIEFIKKAKAQGDSLIIGLHPDDVVKRYKREPIMSFNDRKRIIENVRGVDSVVEDCMDFRKPTMLDNLKKYKVSIAVHGDDWLPPLYRQIKKKKLCKVIQVKSYQNVTTTKLLNKMKKIRNSRIRLQNMKEAVLVSAGDAITAKLIQEAGFDGIWVSGFEASARLGLADNGSITMSEMLNISKTIVEATTLPVIVDVDNGYGGIHNFIRTVREFEKIGCAGICVEDNVFPKENSLWGGKKPLLPMKDNGIKIKAGKEAQKTNDFLIIARTESLIRGYGIKEAMRRANHYARCGADMILIHSRESSGTQARGIPKFWKLKVPLVIVPTKFPQVSNKQLFQAGFSMVVFANQTERVKIQAIRKCLDIIKNTGSVRAIESKLSATLEDMRQLTPMKETDGINRRYRIK